jgi:hypothetical protein
MGVRFFVRPASDATSAVIKQMLTFIFYYTEPFVTFLKCSNIPYPFRRCVSINMENILKSR